MVCVNTIKKQKEKAKLRAFAPLWLILFCYIRKYFSLCYGFAKTKPLFLKALHNFR